MADRSTALIGLLKHVIKNDGHEREAAIGRLKSLLANVDLDSLQFVNEGDDDLYKMLKHELQKAQHENIYLRRHVSKPILAQAITAREIEFRWPDIEEALEQRMVVRVGGHVTALHQILETHGISKSTIGMWREGTATVPNYVFELINALPCLEQEPERQSASNGTEPDPDMLAECRKLRRRVAVLEGDKHAHDRPKPDANGNVPYAAFICALIVARDCQPRDAIAEFCRLAKCDTMEVMRWRDRGVPLHYYQMIATLEFEGTNTRVKHVEWTDEAVRLLRFHFQQDEIKSDMEIAADLSASLGLEVSQRAVHGKASKLGLLKQAASKGRRSKPTEQDRQAVAG